MESEEKAETTRGLRCLVNPLVASDNVFSVPSLTKVLPCAWHSLSTGNSVVGKTDVLPALREPVSGERVTN